MEALPIMNFSVAKVLAGYLTASAAALVASVKLACILGGQISREYFSDTEFHDVGFIYQG